MNHAKMISHTHFAHFLTSGDFRLGVSCKALGMSQPLYFDSQASAAAVLNISIDELREAKRQGCSAFRSGRVYYLELLKWLAARAPADRDQRDQEDSKKARLRVAAEAVIALMNCANRDVITDDQFFEAAKSIIEKAGDMEMKKLFIETIMRFLWKQFPKLSDAHAAHPKIVDWLCEQAGVKYKGSRKPRGS
jgi:hypothetical protein